jgi:hypothetical protein
MRKPRRIELAEERRERLKSEAQRALGDAAAAEDALDTAVRRSIEMHGP